MMQFIWCLIVVCLAPFQTFAKGFELEMREVPLISLINVFYDQVLFSSYMLDPALLNDKRLVSFSLKSTVDERRFFIDYLDKMDIAVNSMKNTDFISFKKKNHFIYVPSFRSVDYLIDSLSSQFLGRFNVQSGKIGSDVLVFSGSQEEINILTEILKKMDVSSNELELIAYVFEVTTNEKNGSALSLVASLLDSNFGIKLDANNALGSFLKVNKGSIKLFYDFLKTDNRFHIVSSPRLRVRSGTEALFSVGAEVPVLDKVVYEDGKERSVQSIDYRSSGVILKVRPRIFKNIIELDINQQLSDFVKTTTGVNNTPTLIKREVNTNIAAKDGEIILLGGLIEKKNSKAKSGFPFLPKKFVFDSMFEQKESDLLILLQVKKI